jgi:hypothetical protein
VLNCWETLVLMLASKMEKLLWSQPKRDNDVLHCMHLGRC